MPELADLVASLGVALLLVAFFLNLRGRLPADARSYQLLNALGAGLACAGAYLIGFVPFVVLEGTWAAVAIAALARGRTARGEPGSG